MQIPNGLILILVVCVITICSVKAWLSYRVGATGDSKAAVGALLSARGQGVCIREYLTTPQDVVYRAACEVHRTRPDMISDCWTFRGRTFVRTAKGDVQDFADVDKMMTKVDAKYRSCAVM